MTIFNQQAIAAGLLNGLDRGGITVDKAGAEIKLGIAVAAYPEGELALKYKHEKYVLPELLEWLSGLDDRVRKHEAFGLWVDDQGAVYADVIEVLPAEQIALAVLKAKSRSQRAIQLLHPNTTLWLTEPGENDAKV